MENNMVLVFRSSPRQEKQSSLFLPATMFGMKRALGLQVATRDRWAICFTTATRCSHRQRDGTGTEQPTGGRHPFGSVGARCAPQQVRVKEDKRLPVGHMDVREAIYGYEGTSSDRIGHMDDIHEINGSGKGNR
ncbi:unnamed protein product [Arctogadus glacialis]